VASQRSPVDLGVIFVGCIAVAGAVIDRSIIRVSSPGGGLLRPTTNEWLGIGALLALTVVAVGLTRFYQRWQFWRVPRERPLTTVAATIVALFLLVEAFTAVTSLAVQEGEVAASGYFSGLSDAARARAKERGSGFSGSTFLLPTDADLYQEMERFYLWHLLDAVPTLKIPETLNWDKPAVELTDKRGGGLLLVFKILVVLPVIRLGVQLWKRFSAPSSLA
jgi:hypothetical protein